jgi:hypothetical protein
MVTSIGLHGSTSMPCTQAAVRPEKAATAGSRRDAALRRSAGESASPVQAYVRGPRRRQLVVSRCHRSRPASRASAVVKGRAMSRAGMRGLRPICLEHDQRRPNLQPNRLRPQIPASAGTGGRRVQATHADAGTCGSPAHL